MKQPYTTVKSDSGVLTRNKGIHLHKEENTLANFSLCAKYNRIGKASILISGMRALSDEVCKNIALAGVASITLLDHETVTEFDLGAQFFLTEASVGQNVNNAQSDIDQSFSTNLLTLM